MSQTPREDDEPLAPPKLCRMASYHPYKDMELDDRRRLLKRQSPFPYADSDDEDCSSSVGVSFRPKRLRLEPPERRKPHEDVVRQAERSFSGPIRDLQDVISLAESYSPDAESKYPFNHRGLFESLPVLRELRDLVGLESVKRDFVDQILFFVQNFHDPLRADKENADPNVPRSNDMFHTVITGPPGVGKSRLCRLLARLYISLGITCNNTVKEVRRSDLVGEYLGQTAAKTQRAIDQAAGGILIIDEAYALGPVRSQERPAADSYAQECLNTLNQNLTEGKGQFICIIAGYRDQLDKQFFGSNPGLRRRFSFRYDLDGYSSAELGQILVRMCEQSGFDVDESLSEKMQTGDYKLDDKAPFCNFAGDVETLLLHAKIAHARRVFGRLSGHKVLDEEDIEKGLTCMTSLQRCVPEPQRSEMIYV